MLVLMPPSSSDGPMLAGAAVLTTGVVADATLIPWVRLPAWCQASIPLSFFAVVAIGAISRAISTSSDPRPELCAAAQLVTRAAFAILFEPLGDGTLVATAGTDGVNLGLRVDPRADNCATALAWRTGRRVYLADTEADPHSTTLTSNDRARALLCQPVTRGQGPTGVLLVGFHESHQHAPASALDLIELLAAEIGAAIERPDLVALLEAQSRRDPLTRAANRRSWDEELERELARSRRSGNPLTVAIIDMDHFKAYNDTHGHLAGDVLLTDFVTAMRTELRSGDVIARWGGDEFALALPDCDLQRAHVIASRLLEVVPNGQTASIGVTQAGPEDTPRALVDRADRAVYLAKDGGRNQVRDDQLPPSPAPPSSRVLAG